MNIFNVIAAATKVFEQGKALKASTLLTNAEAGGAMLYGLLSSIVILLRDLGIEINLGPTDIHTVANGWTITFSFAYAAYRLATNPNAGVKPK